MWRIYIPLIYLSCAIAGAEYIHTQLDIRVMRNSYGVGQSAPYTVDVDKDGGADINFYVETTYSNGRYQYWLSLTTRTGVYVGVWDIGLPYDEPFYTFNTILKGSPVNNEYRTWRSGDLPHIGYDILGGPPSLDSYLAVKIVRNGRTRYGWVRLIFPVDYAYIEETGVLKIKECAYERSPFTNLLAGDGGIDQPLSPSTNVESTGSQRVKITAENVEGMICELQTSSDLKTWERVFVKRSNQETLAVTEAYTDGQQYFRWKVSENYDYDHAREY
ncbi:hypothetical protein [Cerasicoccus frondis]|uniref:hypothetical protein n=1 Tax=Cerasicoccus frondis TaxID=490090 RepID=UPI0028524E35|nr:hypothetical protein [Cerasicoccus frondis]